MTDKSKHSQCSTKCETLFRKCLETGEHESVCRMQRVPCDCSCSED